ncbi:MAG: right-handed parallel beta-helix repeat-containing protein [Solirubrobacteraceae bacterium]
MHARRILTVLGLVLGALLATGSTARAPERQILAAAALGQPAPLGAWTCDRIAEPGEPHAIQRLLDSLRAGQTGCLRGGTYTQDAVRFGHGGAPGARIRLTSYPGERARLLGGIVYVPHGSDHVTVSDVDIDGSASREVTVQVMAADTVFERVGVTNERRSSCMILGSNAGYGRAEGTIVRDSRFHDCGEPAAGNQDHAIYLENAVGTQVVDNLFWNTSAWAIHLYPNARRTTVAHNVIDGNGRGVIFAGDSRSASSENVVSQNVITNSTVEYNVQGSWRGPVGTGNVARDNCLYNGKMGNVGSQSGFTASANTVADPLYVDRAKRDYRLRPGSPCLAVVGYDTAARLARPLLGRLRLLLDRRRQGSAVLRGTVTPVPRGTRVTLEVSRGGVWRALARCRVRAGGRISAPVSRHALPGPTVFVRARADGAQPSRRAPWRAPAPRRTG